MADVGAFFPILNNGCPTELTHGAAALIGVIVVKEDSCFFTVCKNNITILLNKVKERFSIASNGEGIC